MVWIMKHLMRFYVICGKLHSWQIIAFLKTSFLSSYIAENQSSGDIIENQDNNVAIIDIEARTSAANSENSLTTSVEEKDGETNLQKKGIVPNPSEKSGDASPKEATAKGLIFFCFLLLFMHNKNVYLHYQCHHDRVIRFLCVNLNYNFN